jgi:hypothetical protein
MSAQEIRLPDVHGYGELRITRVTTSQIRFQTALDVDDEDVCAEVVVSDEDALRLAATLLDAIGGVRLVDEREASS